MIIDYQKIELQNKTVFEKVLFKPPFRASQIMEDEACFIYSLNGNSIMFGEEEQETLSSGQSVLMRCGNFVNLWQPGEAEEPYEAIAIHFYPSVLRLIFEDNIPEYLQQPINHEKRLFEKIDQNKVLQSFIESLFIYFQNPALFTPDVVRLKLKELIALLYNMDSMGVREILSDLFSPGKIEFKKVIDKHLYQDLALQDYALLVHLSLSSFKRRFREFYQEAPGQYIKSKRLEKAAQMLSTSNARIGDVCFQCGFGDQSNFTRAFSKKFGLSPSEYQNQHLS